MFAHISVVAVRTPFSESIRVFVCLWGFETHVFEMIERKNIHQEHHIAYTNVCIEALRDMPHTISSKK